MSEEQAVVTLLNRMKSVHGDRAGAECFATAAWSERLGFSEVARLWQAAGERGTGPAASSTGTAPSAGTGTE